MQNLGCVNKDAKKNVLHEVTEQGNGKWLKGLTITVSSLGVQWICCLVWLEVGSEGDEMMGIDEADVV